MSQQSMKPLQILYGLKIPTINSKLFLLLSLLTIKPLRLSPKRVTGSQEKMIPTALLLILQIVVFHYREIPAIERDIPVEKMVAEANTTSRRIEGRYKLITRQVETRPAQTREQEIPAKTQTIQRRVLVKDETTTKVTIPAVYKEDTKKVLVKKGGYECLERITLYHSRKR